MTLWVPWGTAVFCAQQGVASHSTHPYGVSCTDGVPIHHATHRAGSAVFPCGWGHAGSAGRTVPGVSRREGRVRGPQGLQPGWVPAVPGRHTEARLQDIFGGSRRVGGPDPRDADGPPARDPAECTSSLAQLPAPSPVLCLQPPLPGCRVTCQQPPAPGTPRPPARQPPAPGVRPSPLPHPPAPALGGQSRGQPNSGPSPSAATPTQLRIPPTPRPPTRTPTA